MGNAGLEELLSGENVSQPFTEAVGCIIGRVRKPDPTSPITYSNQIARIMQRRCVECHRPGEIAPFSLLDYSEVVGWAEMIAEVVRESRMPPWHADPKHGEFVNDRRLTDEEREQILPGFAKGHQKAILTSCRQHGSSSSVHSCRKKRTWN